MYGNCKNFPFWFIVLWCQNSRKMVTYKQTFMFYVVQYMIVRAGFWGYVSLIFWYVYMPCKSLSLSCCFAQFFHFSSIAYPPVDGQFKDRIKWVGSPSQRDASIQLFNASLNDNGTYTCAVYNPPDVHGLPSKTILTVTPKSETHSLTSSW